MDLAEYRARAEAFTIELGSQRHRHYAGLAATLDLAPTYARFADLFDIAILDELREQAGDSRRARVLLGFCVEGHLGAQTHALDAELARRASRAELQLDDGHVIGYRESLLEQARCADPQQRAAIEAARLGFIAERLHPLHAQALASDHAAARELGWPSYRAMCTTISGLDYDALAAQAAKFLDASRQTYVTLLDHALRTSAGVALASARRSDLPPVFAAADRSCPQRWLGRAVHETIADLGLETATAIDFDLAPRAHKSRRAFCAPVRVPQEIHLVVSPTGGRDDYSATLHECGHALHYAWADPALPFESRRLGDTAVTEAYAFLFERLADNPAWLARHVRVPADTEIPAHHAALARLLYVRRYCAKLKFELALHGDDWDGTTSLPHTYAAGLSAATAVVWPQQTWLTDLDPLLYCASYLRAWALETQLRAALQTRFGADWFTRREAGDWLRALWRHGQRFDGDELAAQLGDAETPDFELLLEELATPALSG